MNLIKRPARRLLGALHGYLQARRRWSDQIAREALYLVNAYHNCPTPYNPEVFFETNGERALLQRLAAARPRSVFDVGANRGDWLALAVRYLPEATFHAFEVVPTTYQRLSARRWPPTVTLNDFGLGSEAGEITVRVWSENDALSTTLHAPGLRSDRFTEVTGGIESGARYCSSHGIDRIDLLKLDVEGAEPQVLAGFAPMLKQARIDVIQFEYNHLNIYSRFLLKDYHDLLGTDYMLGKIFRGGVEFKPYSTADEDFRGPNYVAVHRSRRDLIMMLRAPWVSEEMTSRTA